MINTIRKRLAHHKWTTSGLKTIGRSLLRLQLNKYTGIRRVQRLTWLGWRTLPEELSLREAFLFNASTRLVERLGTNEYTEWPTNNILPKHYRYIPVTDPRMEHFIVKHYTTVECGCYWNDDTRGWDPIMKFFEQPKNTPKPVVGLEKILEYLCWILCVGCIVMMTLGVQAHLQ